MIDDRRLSANFLLSEYLDSNTAERHEGLVAEQWDAPSAVVESIEYLNRTVSQPLRDALGWPIGVNSGYRCRKLNRLVNGSATSQHVLGEAADLDVSAGALFLEASSTSAVRWRIEQEWGDAGGQWPANATANHYLWAELALHLDRYDVDQLIYEYGYWPAPAWVHVAASRRQSKRTLTAVGRWSGRQYLSYTSLGELVTEVSQHAV